MSDVMACIKQIFKALLPPEEIGTAEWANKYRYFHPAEGATQGKYNIDVIPHFTWKGNPLEALDDRGTYEVVCMKSAQVAWTTGVLGNYVGKRISHDPVPMLILFPKEGAAKDWNREKFVPMISATPILNSKISLKSKENTWGHKNFPGGFIKIVGSNSAASVKSLPARIIGVEEPDDCNTNLAGQGDSIALAKERAKSFKISLGQVKFIIGGTPTIKKISTIEREMELSDKRYGIVHCHDCHEPHALNFDNFKIPEDNKLDHKIFGNLDPNKAFYACPKCGSAWTFLQKNRNLRNPKNYWKATGSFNGIAGFYLNELYSVFEGSSFKTLAEKYLIAQYEFKELGKPEKLIAFINSSKGEAYEYLGETKDFNALIEFGLDYELGTVPEGGVILTCGVDVQEDRLEYVVRAWGDNHESWLVDRGIIYGNPMDEKSECWDGLYKQLIRYYPTKGKRIRTAMMSIDSGFASEAVYAFVRYVRKKLGDIVMAVKGISNDYGTREIYTTPKSVDLKRKKNKTKADEMGVRVYMVGTQRAKTHINTLLDLAGKLTHRFFWSKHVDDDYLPQLTGEMYAPHRGKMLWQQKAGQRVEALDCEVYAMHAAYRLGLHRKTTPFWNKLNKDIYGTIKKGKNSGAKKSNKGT